MTATADDLLARVLDKVEHRFYGKYRGLVADNADPDKLGRLKVTVPSVLGDIVSGWALPCAPYGGHDGRGFFFIPEKKDGVWVEFEGGLLEYPIWVGTYWCKPGGTTEAPPPGDSQSPPTSKIIKTGKHTIELADEDGKEAIKIEDATNKNKVTLDKDGIVVEDGNSNKVTFASGGVVVEGSAIKIGDGASDAMLKGDTLKQLLDTWFKQVSTHIHTVQSFGPSGPAVALAVPPTLDSALSQKVKVE